MRKGDIEINSVKPMDTSILDKAIIFATQAHAGQERKGKHLPYIVHPLEAVAIVATMTNDQEMLAAAALHDTLEDTPVTIGDLRREFGDRVAALVDFETNKGGSWREAKQRAVNRLAAAPYDAQVVALGDKLSNLRALSRDYVTLGDSLWSRFKAPGGKADIGWYYRSLAHALSSLADLPPYKEFLILLDRTFHP